MPDPKSKSVFEIERNLVLSTTHITQKDAELLAKDAAAKTTGEKTCLIVYDYSEGFFVYCEPDEAFSGNPLYLHGYSEHLVLLIRLTRGNSCKFLHLDSDGPEHDDLPKHDW